MIGTKASVLVLLLLAAATGASAETERLSGSAEYLLWWMKNSPAAPPLLSTGTLGDPDFSVVFGARDYDTGAQSGGRFTVGYRLNRDWALEAGPYNVNVNAVHPGIVGGERMAKLCREKARRRGAGWTPERVYQEYVDEMALRRVTTAQDVADTVCFLASDESKNMTGQSITVDGGWDV